MSLKSNIDWNEIIPRLSKAKRDDMYLEAVTLLSQEPTKKGRRGGNGDWKREHGQRVWGDSKVEGGLCESSRVYKINAGAKKIPHRGALGKIWPVLVKIKGGEIDFPTLDKLAKNIKSSRSGKPQKGIAFVNQLWSRGFIDVVR